MDGFFQFLVDGVNSSRNTPFAAPLFFQSLNFRKRLSHTFFRSVDTYFLPKDFAQPPVEIIDRFVSLHAGQKCKGLLDTQHRISHEPLGLRSALLVGFSWQAGQIIGKRIRQDEESVCQSLHKGRGAQAVCAVVAEIGLANGKKPLYGSHQVVIYPQASHSVMDGRVNHHGFFTRIYVSDFFIHLEQVAVFLFYDFPALRLYGVRKVQKNSTAREVDPKSVVAPFQSGSRSHITRNQIAVRRIASFQVVISVLIGNIGRPDFAFAKCCRVFLFGRYPNAAVVA